MDEAKKDEILGRVQREIDEAVEYAEGLASNTPEDLYTDVYGSDLRSKEWHK